VSAAPRVVLLHGFLGSPEDFDALRRDLADFACEAPDLARLRGRDVAALADELAASLGPRPPRAVLGYSLGGRVALALAVRHPHAAERFVAVSAHPGLRDPAERARRAAADDLLAEDLLRNGMEAFVDSWYRQPLFAPLRTHAAFDDLRSRRGGGAPGPWAALLRGCSPGRTEPTWDRLASIGDRLAFITGELDAKYRDLAAEAARHAPAARFATVADAGHAVHLERPAALAAAVRPFLAPAA